MSSELCEELYGVGKRLRNDGFPVSATICERASVRMADMEKLLVDQNNASNEQSLQNKEPHNG